MTPEEHKAIGRRIAESLSRGDVDAAASHFAPNYVDHTLPPGVPPTAEGFKRTFGTFREAFPDFHYTIEDEIAEGDMLVQRLMGHGTMKGNLMGMPATGKRADWQEIHVARFENGKVVEHWGNIDQLGMLQQLGLMPVPQAT